MKSKTPKKSQFSIKLTIADKVYQGKGETALAALQTLQKPEKIMYKGTLELSDGKATKSMLFYPMRLKRLFYSKFFQSIQIKQLIAGMK